MTGVLTQEFMADVRLRSIVWLGGVAHVLCGVERLERKAIEEIARVQ